MKRRPVIGIPTQTLQSMGGVSADFPPSWVMSQRYVNALTAAGAVPWLIPLVDDEAAVRAIYDDLDGLFLPGGADIDPASYSEARHPLCDRSDPARDRLELTMARWAMADHRPVLGVCRGLQLMNLAAGGTLYQDLGEQMPGSIKHDFFPFEGNHRRDFLAHEVTLAEGSRIADILGAARVRVNSMHHQGIRDLGDGLVATATAPDGLIEGAEAADGSFFVGVQWHPEALTESDPRTRRLFEEFVAAATPSDRAAPHSARGRRSTRTASSP